MKIDESMYLANKQEKDRQPNDVLGKDDFLKLLITQLQNQDPTEPMKDKEFISQMSAFTSLEQTGNMNSLLERFIDSQSQNILTSQANMIGKQITWAKPGAEEGEETTVSNVTSIVKAVTLKDGAVTYVTEDNESIDPSQLVSISNEQIKPGVEA